MEVWGGNRAIDTSVVMPGLDAWIYSRPYGPAGAAVDGRSPAIEGSSVDGTGDTIDPGARGGGDIHYVTSCATGRVTRLIIADVSGHGAPVAEAAIALRRLMRRFSNYIDQRRFVESVNARFGELSAEAQAGDFGAMFATAVVATYYAPTDELSISLAGHPRPMRYSAATERWQVLAPSDQPDVGARTRRRSTTAGPSNLPLGVLESTVFTSDELLLGPNDLVLFYTDALIEAKGANGRQLGERGLIEILDSLDVESPKDLVPRLLETIAGGFGGGAFDDDVTALLIKRNANKPRASIFSGLTSGYVVLKHAVRSLRPGGLPLSLPPLTVESIFGSFIGSLAKGKRRRME
jgi:hypothetical protein